MFGKNPYDINRYIINFLDFDSLLKIIKSSKTIPSEIKAEYIRQKHAKLVLKKFYNKYNINAIMKPYDDSHFNPNYSSTIPKKIEIRHYMACYPQNWLIKYPEFLVSKCSNRLGQTKVNTLTQYIQTKLNSDKNLRTRREIKSFLELPQISVKDIHFMDGKELKIRID